MLLVLIVVAILLYAGMYFAFSSLTDAKTGNSGVAISLFKKVQDVVFHLPASLPLAILKVMLSIFIIYIVLDFLSSTIRRTRLRNDQKQRKADLHRTLHGE